MDTKQFLDNENNTLELTPSSRNFLLETADWSIFLAIVGFIISGFIVFAALGLGYIFGMTSTATIDSRGLGSMGGTVVSAVYLIIGILCFVPFFYLFQFSVKTRRAIKNSNTLELTDALENLKSFCKFLSISTMVILAIYLTI